MGTVWRNYIWLIYYLTRLSAIEFTKLSSISTLSNHAKSSYCNIISWFSTAQNTESFMINILDHDKGDIVVSDIISFSPAPSYSYYYQSTVESTNASLSDSRPQTIQDVIATENSILILASYYDSSVYKAWFLLYRFIYNYHDPLNIHKGPIRKMKINSDTPYITATKLLNTDTFIVINNHKDDIVYYVLNQTTERMESSTPKLLQSTSSIYWSDSRLIVRASQISERYLMIWEGHNIIDIYGELRSNDGALVRSQFLINRVLRTYKQYIQDLMSLRISDKHGFFVILYQDASHSVNETLRICILDDFGTHLKNDDDDTMELVLFMNNKAGHSINSAKFTQVGIGLDNKMYIAVIFGYELDDDDASAVYVQLIEFSWNDEYTEYHLNITSDPFQITSSSTKEPHSVCVSCVNNKILVVWLNSNTYETNIQLLSTNIEFATTKSPSNGTVSDPSLDAKGIVIKGGILVFGIIIICACVVVILYKRKKRQKSSEETMTLMESATDPDPFNIILLDACSDVHDDDSLDIVKLCKLQEAKTSLSKALHKYVTAMQNNTLIDDIDIQQVLNDYHALIPHLETNTELQLSACNVHNCCIYRRHYRDSSSARNENEVKQMDVYTPKYCAKLNILDKVHCFCEHASMIVPYAVNNVKSGIDVMGESASRNIRKEFKKRMNNKYNQLHVAKDHDNNRNVFVLGCEIKYVQSMNDEKEKDNECIYVTPKYASLKEEVTESHLLIAQFATEYHKAHKHDSSFHKKKYYSNIGFSHLLALMIYCNFDHLQHIFSATYREKNGLDHEKFYHFGKLLKEAVLHYGRCIRDGSIMTFYHGMNQRLVPTQIVGDFGKGIRVFIPLSTSSNAQIAQHFADAQKGLIMSFGGRTSEAKYFSVEWLSDFSYEKEYLFLQNKNELHIKDIIECKTAKSFGWILDRLKVMDSILCEAHYGEHNRFKDELLEDILRILNHQLSIKQSKLSIIKPIVDPQNDDDFKGFAQDLLTVYFENKEKLTINCSLLKRKYKMLFELICFDKYQWIRIDVLATIFPRLKNIEIKDINLCAEIMEDISKNRKVFGPNNKTWKLPTMTLRVKKRSSLKAVDAMAQYEDEFLNNPIKLFILNPVDISNKEYDTIVIK